MTENPNSELHSGIDLAIMSSGKESLGVINNSFLMESIGGLTRKMPLCLDQDLDAQSVVEQLIQRRVGSVLLIDKSKKVVGIFTERDYLETFAITRYIEEKSRLKMFLQ